MATKLFVGNLDYTVTTDDLRNHFANAGTLSDCIVITDRATGRSRGFGFVEFENDEEAKQALETLNGSDLKGRQIKLNEARPQQPRE